MPDLLIELLSEEIPARMQARAAQDLRALLTDGLVEAGLTYADAQAFATPRRLALAVSGLDAQSPTRQEERRGPRTDAPEKAIDGFLRANGLTRDQLRPRDEKKGQIFVASVETLGRPAAAIVAEVLERVIRTFPWPKSMRWGTGSLRWVRPLHAILCVLTDDAGAQVVPLDLDGIIAGNTTRGHRFMAPAPFAVTGFSDYQQKLQRAFVVLDAAARADHIRVEARSLAFALGLELVEDPALLAEVAGLVEWPVVLSGEIDGAFLTLPPEVLQTSMREHQKFFSLRDPSSGQIVRFVTVANRQTADEGATILAGNRKVLAARLSDARFFWENDLRMVAAGGMEAMAAGLASVTFHGRLGTQQDRIARIAALARQIAPRIGADAEAAALAASIAKADLQSGMVGEFPELQGVMGVYYARAAGLSPDVAAACREHYQPLGPGDSVPTNPVSVSVALADKLDTLGGFWAIDEKPTGSKDPYALRRAALGVIRLVLANGARLRLSAHLGQAIGLHQAMIGATRTPKADQTSAGADLAHDRPDCGDADALVRDLLAFLHDRLKVHLRDQGIRHDVIDACLHDFGTDVIRADCDDIGLLVGRSQALNGFLRSDDGENLIQGFRRANNILTQAEARDGVEYSFGPDPKLADTPQETALFAALDTAEAAISPAIQAQDFPAAMAAMARLRAPIDAFFDSVQINADSAVLRRNRLNLLHRIRAACLQVADLTRLEG